MIVIKAQLIYFLFYRLDISLLKDGSNISFIHEIKQLQQQWSVIYSTFPVSDFKLRR